MTNPSLLLTLAVGLLVLAAFTGLGFLGLKSRTEVPEYLAERDLSHDSGKPNFVSSLIDDPDKKTAPLSISGNPESAWKNAVAAILATPRTETAVEEEHYFRAETKSRVFGFVDDVEIRWDPGDEVIHIRSSSRVGHSDMGANAERVEEIRERFEKAQAKVSSSGPT